VPDNLVKICPVCHKALKKSVGTEKIQKDYIKNILRNNTEVKTFSINYFGTLNENDLIEKIYQNLR
jgi:5-methylcytosine-specific restriction protein A